MTRESEAQARLVMLLTLRAMGVVLMLLGIGLWLGGWMGGYERMGAVIFVAGAVLSLLLPAVLARRWRSPRR